MVKSRMNLPVDPEFIMKLKELQRKIYANGGEASLRGLTEQIARQDIFVEIEKKVLDIANGKSQFDIIRFDKRRKI